jgi:hypothetical protein
MLQPKALALVLDLDFCSLRPMNFSIPLVLYESYYWRKSLWIFACTVATGPRSFLSDPHKTANSQRK